MSYSSSPHPPPISVFVIVDVVFIVVWRSSSLKEILGFEYFFDLELASGRNGREFVLHDGQLGALIEEGLEQVARVQPAELGPADLVHRLHRRRVRPKAVVHGTEGDAAPVRPQRRQHHVRRIQRVDVVRHKHVRHGRLVDGKTCSAVERRLVVAAGKEGG